MAPASLAARPAPPAPPRRRSRAKPKPPRPRIVVMSDLRALGGLLYEQAVLDAELKVRGVDGLRVADASSMPEIIRGNTNAPSIMIAEKAADMILGRSAPTA